MADNEVKISDSEKEAIVNQATKASEAVVKSKDKEKVGDLQDAVASIAPDATFEQTKDELTIKVPLGSEEERQKLIDKFVAQKLSAAQAEAERIAEEKVKAEMERLTREKLEAAKKAAEKAEQEKAAVKEEPAPAPEPVKVEPVKAEPIKAVEPVKVVEKPVEKPAKPAAVKKVVKPTVVKPAAVKKPVAAKKPATAQGDSVKVVLVKSLIGTLPNQRKTAKALGLSKKISSYSIRPNNAVTRGMIEVVKHLVRVEEI